MFCFSFHEAFFQVPSQWLVMFGRHAFPRRLPAHASHGYRPRGSQVLSHNAFISARTAKRYSKITAAVGSSPFEGKGTHYTLETSCLERISQLLAHHRLRTWGFVIYRCTYEDESAWERFMERLNRHRDGLPTHTWTVVDPDDPIPWDLMKQLDWRVQEDPKELDGASKDEVRRRFRQLVSQRLRPEESDPETSHMAKQENPRWNFCVHVDKESLESILRDLPDGRIDHLRRQRYVNLIRADSDWEDIDYDHFDWSKHKPPEDPEEDDPHDENEVEVEGSRRYDVGWMKVQVDDLIPGLYDNLIQCHSWDSIYVRPTDGIAG